MTKLTKLSIFACFLIFMSGMMTALFTWIGLVEGAQFMDIWPPTWARALSIMVPLSFVILFATDVLFQKLMPNAPDLLKLVLQSLTMAVCMDGLMTGLASYQTFGFTYAMLLPWGKALLAGLPFGILISVFMTFFVKPRLQRFMAA